MSAIITKYLSERDKLCFNCSLTDWPDCCNATTRCPWYQAPKMRVGVRGSRWQSLAERAAQLQPGHVDFVLLETRPEAQSAQASLLGRRRTGSLPPGLTTWTRDEAGGPVYLYFMVKP